MKKRRIKKGLIILAIVLILLVIFAGSVYANDRHDIDDVVDGIVGILLYPLRLGPLIAGACVKLLSGAVADEGLEFLSLDKVFFTSTGSSSPVSVTSIDFFGLADDSHWGGNTSIFCSIRNSVSLWYVGVRNLAAVILIIIAFYVGLRMALATVAEEQAKYKQMLYDWLKSLGLLFAMHFIMLFIIFLNDQLIQALYNGFTSKMNGNIKDVSSQFAKAALTTASFSAGMGFALCYAALAILTFKYLLTYIKRMITIAFLIIISPLVTVTYSIDKMGDSKSQALNTWFKEFIYNILIQPFHCVIYLSLTLVSFDLLQSHNPTLSGDQDASLAAAVVAIVIVVFIGEAEKIVKHIFHFQANSMPDPVAEAALISAGISKASKAASNRSNKYADAGDDDDDKKKGEGGKPPKQKDAPNPEGGAGANPVGGAPGGGSGASPKPKKPSGKDRRKGTADQNQSAARDRAQKNVDKDKKRKDRADANSKGGRRVISGAASLYGGLLKAGAKATFAVTAGVMGYALTGKADRGLLVGIGANSFRKNMEGKAKDKSVEQGQRNLAKAYHDFQDANPGMSDDDVKAEALRLHNMTDEEFEEERETKGVTVEQENLRNRMKDLRNRYVDDGLDKEKVDKVLSKDLNKIENGDIGEYTTVQRFVAKARNRGPKTKNTPSSNPPGPNTPGPNPTGPNTPGPNTPGPNPTGPNTPGPNPTGPNGNP